MNIAAGDVTRGPGAAVIVGMARSNPRVGDGVVRAAVAIPRTNDVARQQRILRAFRFVVLVVRKAPVEIVRGSANDVGIAIDETVRRNRSGK